MIKFPVTLNSYLVGLVDIWCNDVSRNIGKIIGESIGNTFKKSIGGSIGNTFLMKYKYWYWQYFLKILLTTLLIIVYT